MLSRQTLLHLILAIIPSTFAAQENVFTENPTSNSSGSSPIWRLGQEVTITWTTDRYDQKLGFFSGSKPTSLFTFYNALGPDQNTCQWTVDVNGSDWSQNNTQFFLSLSDTEHDFTSMPVIILEAEKPKESPQPAVSPSTSSTRSASSTNSAQTSTSNSSFQSASDSEAPVAKSGPSGGAIAGIVIGVLALVAVAVGALLFLLRRRRGASTTRKRISKASISGPYEPYGGAAADPVLSPQFAANPRSAEFTAEKLIGGGLGLGLAAPVPAWERKKEKNSSTADDGNGSEHGDAIEKSYEYRSGRPFSDPPATAAIGDARRNSETMAELDAYSHEPATATTTRGYGGAVEIGGSEVVDGEQSAYRTTLWPSAERAEERTGLLGRQNRRGASDPYTR